MGNKLKAVAKRVSDVLACNAKAFTNATFGVGACDGNAQFHYFQSFSKAGTCVGADLVCRDIADGCTGAVLTAMTDAFPSKCEAAKLIFAPPLA